MTYKQIDASREVRLWIGQVIVPTAILAATIITTNPRVRQTVGIKFANVKNSIRNKFKRA